MLANISIICYNQDKYIKKVARSEPLFMNVQDNYLFLLMGFAEL